MDLVDILLESLIAAFSDSSFLITKSSVFHWSPAGQKTE